LELEQLWNKSVRSYRHYMIIHPYLYQLTLIAFELNGNPYVSLDYRSRQYQNMLETVEQKTKNKMDRALD